MPKEGFVGMTVQGISFSDRQEAGEAILTACRRMESGKIMEIGTYRGFSMELSFESFSREFRLGLKGEMTHWVSLGSDARGNITRLDHSLKNIEQKIESAKHFHIATGSRPE